MDNETKQTVLTSFLLIILIIFGVYIVISPTEYDCSKVKPELLSSSLNACFEKELRTEEIELENDKMTKELELNKYKELHKTCRLAFEKGIYNCEEQFRDRMEIAKLVKDFSCDFSVKTTMCTPKMFLWKLWHF